MKPSFLLVFLIALTVQAADAPGSAGRYQLVPATITSSIVGLDGKTRIESTPELFRIDTATGRTWRLVTVNVMGKASRGWDEIPERGPAVDFSVLTNLPPRRE